VTIEEGSGKIAVCEKTSVYIYRPVGREEGVLRVCHQLYTKLAGAESVAVVPDMRFPR
jgi:hypothetical protein